MTSRVSCGVRIRVVQRVQLAVEADHGRRARGQVEVGGVALHHLQQDLCEVELHRGLLSAGPGDHVTLATSAMDVTPFLTFSKPSARSGRMPCATATLRISSARGALDREVANLVADHHDLVEADPALVAGAAAAVAADRLVGLEVEGHVEAGLLERRRRSAWCALAVGAELAHEPLGHDACRSPRRSGTARCPSR